MDDLDAFFDDVSAAEAKAQTEEPPKDRDEEQTVKEPPAKKPRVLPPRGVVVAAASSAAVSAKSSDSTKPAVEAPATAATRQQSTTTATSAGKSFNIPPPPPPPPLPTGAPPPPPPPPPMQHASNTAAKPHVRTAAGKVWTDPTLADWPDNDFRMFVGNLGNEISDEALLQHFSNKYASAQRSRIIRDNKTGASKGYGFVSFLDPLEFARAMREMDQTWLSSRPIRIKKSHWKDREWKEVKKKEKKTQQQRRKFGMM